MDPSESSVTERQEDEVQALQAIYGEDVSVVRKNVSFDNSLTLGKWILELHNVIIQF